MGNIASALSPSSPGRSKSKQQQPMMSFPGSTLLLDNPLCGSLRDTIASPDNSSSGVGGGGNSKKSFGGFLRHQADHLCVSTDQEGNDDTNDDDIRDDSSLADRYHQQQHQHQQQQQQHNHHESNNNANPTSALFARALVSEVTNNPNTMTPKMMAEREKRLLKAQDAARKQQQQLHSGGDNSSSTSIGKPVGAPGGVGQPTLLGSLAYVLGATASPTNSDTGKKSSTAGSDKSTSVLPPNSIQENRAQTASHTVAPSPSKYSVTIGLSLSRRHSTQGHPDTVTRQTAFDFNELQDRQYKYVSSTDSSGWMAGGGERGGTFMMPTASSDYGHGLPDDAVHDDFDGAAMSGHFHNGIPVTTSTTPKAASTPTQYQVKIAAPDTVHIPIIQIDADSPAAVDAIIGALARGEVFIPHMAILPESLSVNGISPPDLVVRFGCERNEDVPPEEWPNWCLEFMHNQLYEYFLHLGARWTKRPFHITLAKKVRWKTVKHMNRYFAHAERVIDAWREKGPQYLDPQLSYIEGGATPEEVARPHGIYLMRNGIPTNYFPPNFDPPYTTKMTRSLLLNVLGKSWNKQRREWSSDPIPKLVTPAVLMATMCGCADPTPGFLATEVTQVSSLSQYHQQQQLPIVAEHNSNMSEQQRAIVNNHHVHNNTDVDTNHGVSHHHHQQQHHQNSEDEAAVNNSNTSAETFHTMKGPLLTPMLHSQHPQQHQQQQQQQQHQQQQQQLQQQEHATVEHRQGTPESSQRVLAATSTHHGGRDEVDDGAPSPNFTGTTKHDQFAGNSMPRQRSANDISPVMAPTVLSPEGGEGSVLSPFGQGFVDDDEERVNSSDVYPFEDENNVKEEKKMEDEPLNDHFPYMKQHKQRSVYADHATHQNQSAVQSPPAVDSPSPSPGPHRSRGAALAEVLSTDTLVTSNILVHEVVGTKNSTTPGRGPTPERLRMKLPDTRHQVHDEDDPAISPGLMSDSDDDESGAFFHEQLTTPKSEMPDLPSRTSIEALGSSGDLHELNSTTASSSTVAHLNLSPAKLVQREYERKMAREGKGLLLNGEGLGSPSSQSRSGSKIKKDKETIERERNLHIAMIAIAQDSSVKTHDHIQRYLKDPRKVELARAIMEAEKEKIKSPNRFLIEKAASPSRSVGGSPGLQRANSGISLDYSVDSSMLGDASSALTGSAFPTDASVGTATSRRTQRSTGTAGSVRSKKIMEEDDGSTSLQESYSESMEPIPSDAELFAIGWAKALDPKSGSYYYFSLDRTKIVWDNPLAHVVESAGSADSVSLPPGSAMI